MADYNFFQLAVPLAGLCADAVFQVFQYRCSRAKNLVKSVLVGFAVGLAVVILMEVTGSYVYNVGPSEHWCIFVANLVTYTGLAYCYFVVIGLGASLRIRILAYLGQSSEGVNMKAIEEWFDARGLFDRRLDRLVENAQIRFADGRFLTVESSFLRIAKLNLLAKHFLTGKTSQFH